MQAVRCPPPPLPLPPPPPLKTFALYSMRNVHLFFLFFPHIICRHKKYTICILYAKIFTSFFFTSFFCPLYAYYMQKNSLLFLYFFFLSIICILYAKMFNSFLTSTICILYAKMFTFLRLYIKKKLFAYFMPYHMQEMSAYFNFYDYNHSLCINVSFFVKNNY